MNNLTKPSPSITPGDILYTLFRHKWKIILCSVLGGVAAVGAYFLLPKPYSSQARLFIRYVEQGKTPTSAEPDSRVTTVETRGDAIINSELQIITSMDLALQVARKLGPGRILGDSSLAMEEAKAAMSIRDTLSVSIPRSSSVISIDYTHSDATLVQPVLEALIDAYLAKHLQTRSAGSFDSFVNQQAEQYRSRLARTEEELRDALARAGVISLEEAKADHNSKIASIRGALFDSNAELASRESTLEEMRKLLPSTPITAEPDAAAETAPASIDPATLQTYASLQARLDLLRRNERDLLMRYTLENSLVKGAQTQIAEAEARLKALEQEHPLLVHTEAAPGVPKTSNAISATDVNAALIQVIALQSKIKVLESQFAQIQQDAARISSVETEIQELRRRKEIEEQNYRYFSESREQAKIDEAFGAGRVNNIGIVQQPSPPYTDSMKTKKLAGGILAAGLALGIGWAFLIELVLDQSVKRPIDVKRALDIPLFLSIPDTNSRAYRKLLRKTGNNKALLREKRSKTPLSKREYNPKSPTLIAAAMAEPGKYGDSTLASENNYSPANAWESDHQLYPYFEALRDRMIGFFEGRNLVHKPKLIGLTGLGDASGNTTIAAGLASTLSKTGEGNVLLVDMTLGQESAQRFYEGNAVSNLEDLLETPREKDPNGRLVVAAEGETGQTLPKILPHRFNHLVPKLKASDFDYIIFDMPAVSPISVTPRLASFMDAVLLVIEAEKATKEVVERAAELLGKTNANVGAILNKTKSYVPQGLQAEYLGDL